MEQGNMMTSFEVFSEMNDDNPSNALLSACKDASSPQEFLNLIESTYGPCNTITPHVIQQDANGKDEENRNFLHILSQNERLLSSLEISDDINETNIFLTHFINRILIPAKPDAIRERDNSGYLPFEESMKEWVTSVHSNFSLQSPMNEESQRDTDSEKMLVNYYHTSLPTEVKVTPKVKSNLFLLSTIIDNLDNHQQHSRPKHSRLSNMGFSTMHLFDINHHVNQSTPQETQSQGIIIQLAKMPGLVKLVVLLEDDDEWSWMINCSAIRLIMMRGESIGGWLISMLRSDQKRTNCATEYLVQLSLWFDEEKEESNAFARNFTRRQFYQVCKKIRHLDGLIPSISALDTSAASHLASTSIIQNVLDKIMVSTSSLSLVFFDSIFLSLLIFSFRRTVKGYLLRPRDELDEWMTWIQVMNGFLFYFFVRFLMKSTSTLAKMGFFFLLRTWLLNVLNVIDLSALILACSSNIIMRTTFSGFKLGESNIQLEQFILAATTWLLWLKWAGIIQGLHEKAAFYVVAFWEITKDVMWFTVVLILHGWCFQQVTFTMLVPAECQAHENKIRQCSPEEYFITAYSVMVGDFLLTEDRDRFTSILSIIGFIIFSFVVMILLLNILIAVINDSYEKCLAQSSSFFAYARMTVVTEVLIFQTIFGGRGKIYTPHWEKGRFLFFSTFISGTLLWIGIEIFLLNQYGGAKFPSIVRICITVPVTYFAITMISLPGRLKSIFKIIFKPMKYTMTKWIVTKLSLDEPYVGNNDGKRWRGRILRLESQIKRSEKSVKKEIEAAERRTRDMIQKKTS